MSKPTEPCWKWYGDQIVKVAYRDRDSYPEGEETKHLEVWLTGWLNPRRVAELDDDKWGESIPDDEELKRLKELDGIVSTVRSVDEARLDAADVQTRTTTGNQQGEQS